MAPRKKRKPARLEAPTPFDVESYLQATDGGHRFVQYRRRAVVYTQGDRADDVRYVQKGAVHLSVLSRGGKEAVVAAPCRSDYSGVEGTCEG